MICIQSIKPYFAGSKKSIEQLEEFPNIQGAELEYAQNCGVQSIHDSGESSSYDLALGASKALLEENGIDSDELDFIIYIKSRTPQYLISSEASRLKYDLQAEKAQVFSISDLGCTDSTMAVKLARDLLLANRRAKHVLVCYGSKKYASVRFRYPVTFTGDGGVACLIGRGEEHVIKDIRIDTNGSYWELFKIDYQKTTAQEYREECSDLRRYGFELAIESKNRFTDLNEAIFQSHDLDWNRIEHYFLQNISSRAFDYYEQAFEIKFSPVCQMNLSTYGHLGAADILLNYHSALQNGLLNSGQHALLMNNSPVAAWGSILIEI
ncbi:MAG: hypothetical protein EP338_04760 [Bacteroidetes bacterium]|nr:MAG: hypothetical protein EP338_04760 [Bacteroidota bacterium]